jgi:acetyl-CoA decarbonylase/synthase complex subunit delta
MAIEIPKTSYNGKVRDIVLGLDNQAITVGVETCYPLPVRRQNPNNPRIAMEVWEHRLMNGRQPTLEPFAGVTDDPVAWRKNVLMIMGRYEYAFSKSVPSQWNEPEC